jgi:hypothetical protein
MCAGFMCGNLPKGNLSLFPSIQATCRLANHRGADQHQPPLASTRLYGRMLRTRASVAPRVSGQRTNEDRPASRSQPTSTAEYEGAHVTSRPPRRPGPIASFPTQPSRRAITTLPGSSSLHSVQSSCGLYLERTSYEKRPF